LNAPSQPSRLFILSLTRTLLSFALNSLFAQYICCYIRYVDYVAVLCCCARTRCVSFVILHTSAARSESAAHREREERHSIYNTYYKHPRMSLTPLEIVLFVLSGLYIPLVILPLVQLIRIHFRAPEVGWTTQKLFLTLTALSSIGTHSSSDAFQCGSDLFILLFWLKEARTIRMSLMQYIHPATILLTP
jgi:hypothetical protein